MPGGHQHGLGVEQILHLGTPDHQPLMRGHDDIAAQPEIGRTQPHRAETADCRHAALHRSAAPARRPLGGQYLIGALQMRPAADIAAGREHRKTRSGPASGRPAPSGGERRKITSRIHMPLTRVGDDRAHVRQRYRMRRRQCRWRPRDRLWPLEKSRPQPRGRIPAIGDAAGYRCDHRALYGQRGMAHRPLRLDQGERRRPAAPAAKSRHARDGSG